MMRAVKSGPIFSRRVKILLALFVFSLPLVNPWVRGDGVGYFAYARSLLIERRLDFEKDWQHGNQSFVTGRLGPGWPRSFERIYLNRPYRQHMVHWSFASLAAFSHCHARRRAIK
jgi:hypothetical protein